MLLMEEMQQANAAANAASTALVAQVLETRRVILRCNCEGDLNTFPGTPHRAPPTAMPATIATIDLWHQWLGHPGCHGDRLIHTIASTSSSPTYGRRLPCLHDSLPRGPDSLPRPPAACRGSVLCRDRAALFITCRASTAACRGPVFCRGRAAPHMASSSARPRAPLAPDGLSAPPPTTTRSGRLVHPVDRLDLSVVDDIIVPVPSTFHQAMQHPQWRQAMSEEHQALFDNGTWSLVPHPPCANIITDYMSLAGALQYLTLTRPDISYVVQQICLYMHAPRKPHIALVKRVLRYVRGTLDFGLHLRASSSTALTAYFDVDWAGYPDTRRSTSGHCVYYGDSLISWSSKRQPTVSRSNAEAEYRDIVGFTNYYRNFIDPFALLHLSTATMLLLYTCHTIQCSNVEPCTLRLTYTSSARRFPLVKLEFSMFLLLFSLRMS
ncbi:hypothetical protein QYE76_021513 [Lolium multiflorum]|uniref:Uncharacterized protein n=1 Tax=Lolium multiflorum TaxID=4521 RepID=A0AAD8VSA4_LOLMU|nr:hypothetical protein QYE76_021513 [Lolium multiflorum]